MLAEQLPIPAGKDILADEDFKNKKILNSLLSYLVVKNTIRTYSTIPKLGDAIAN